MYNILLTIHLIGATVWVGGHLILLLGFLPRALLKKDHSTILTFEKVYETIGIPSLILQVVSGFWMGFLRIPEFFLWWDFSNYTAKLLGLKVIFLVLTFLLALHARLRIIPNLNPNNLVLLAFHILGVNILALLLLFTGLSFRTGII